MRSLVFRLIALTVLAGAVGWAFDGSSTEPTGRARASVSYGYGWPVKPFFRQHVVRGLIGDPRIGPASDGEIHRTLHLGVDVVAPDGTAVYATLSGWVSIHPLHSDTVMVSDGAERVFEYGHVVPAMRSGHATAYRTVIGHVEAPWAHVNFAERLSSRYLNPLRPGAMGPYGDGERPRLGSITFECDGRAIGRVLSGRVDVVVEASDAPALTVPPPWSQIRLTPAIIRWRVLRLGQKAAPTWRNAFDVRDALPTTPFSLVYAAGTRQNRTDRVGRYRFYLVHAWNTSVLSRGSYVLQVSALDIRANEAVKTVPFVIVAL